MKNSAKRKNVTQDVVSSKKIKVGQKLDYPIFPREIWLQIFDFAIRNDYLVFANHFNRIAKFARLIIQDLAQQYLKEYYEEGAESIPELLKSKSYGQVFFKLARQESKRFTYYATDKILFKDSVNLNDYQDNCIFESISPIYRTYNMHIQIKNRLIEKSSVYPQELDESRLSLNPLDSSPNLENYLKRLIRYRAYEKISSFYGVCEEEPEIAEFVEKLLYIEAVARYNPVEFSELQMIVPFDINNSFNNTAYEIYPSKKNKSTSKTLYELAIEFKNWELADYLKPQQVKIAATKLIM